VRRFVVLCLVLAPLAARAETVYVSDRLVVALRAAAADTAAVVKALEVGTPLEVLERAGNFARVRDRQGTEGWAETRHLAAEPPARAQLARVNEELARLRAQLGERDAELKKTQALLAQESAKLKELAARPAAAAAEADKPADAAPPAPTAGDSGAGGGNDLLVWLGACFAMLVVGFGAGILWLRESIRRRSGGMYLRV
jgi:SH3 domain protein